MEYMDVVSENDETLRQAPRNEIYERKLPHRIVHILVYNGEGKMALQLQSRNKKFCPLHWCNAAAGHVSAGETPKEAAKRELEEEIGVTKEIEFAFKFLYFDPRRLKKFISVYKTNYNGPFELNPEEVEKLEFFTMNEIKKMIAKGEKFHPELLYIIKNHLEK